MNRRAVLAAGAALIGALVVTRPDDIVGLWTAQPNTPAQPMSYRQGVILEWDPITLENRVVAGGATFTNLPVLGVQEAASFRPGVVVGLVVVGSTWAIVGQLVIPGTAAAAEAITFIGSRTRTAAVATLQSTTSSSFVDLATVGPTISDMLVPASGKIQVALFANLGGPGNSMSLEVSGATSIAPSTQRSLAIAGAGFIGSAVILYEGLPAGGLVTFQAKYRGPGGGTPADFSDRTIIATAL